jgi:hypothetical protein
MVEVHGTAERLCPEAGRLVHVRSLTIDQEGADRSHASGNLQCTIDIDTNSLATASSKARGRGKCPYLASKGGVLRFRPSR